MEAKSDKKTITKNCFVELDFIATADGKVFDTTKPDVAKDHGLKGEAKPLIVPIGSSTKYILRGLDEFLLGKTIGKYKVTIPAEKAFGNKMPGLFRLYSLSAFKSFNINPEPGLTVNIDGNLGIIKTVSSGRVLVDFNHPLAGKDVVYDIEVKRIVDDINEKIRALIQLHGLEKLSDFKLSDKKLILTFKEEKRPLPNIDDFKKSVREILGLELVINNNSQ